MPNKCCVRNCTSNYNSKSEVVSVFKFPNEDDMKNLWLKAIRRKDFIPSKQSVVCIKHFKEEDVKRENLHGSLKIPLKRPQLLKGVIPSKFPDSPKYLNIQKKHLRKDPETRTKEIYVRESKKKIESEIILMKKDIINSYEDFSNQVIKKINLEIISYKLSNNQIILYVINENVEIIRYVTISNKLDVNYISKTENIVTSNLPKTISRWSQFKLVINFLENNIDECANEDELIKQAILNLTKVMEFKDKNSDFKYFSNIEVLRDQLELVISKKKKYSNSTLINANLIRSQSAATYKIIRENNILILPSRRTLQRLSTSLQSSTTDNKESLEESNSN